MISNTLYIYERINKKGKKVTTYSLTQNAGLGTLIGTAYRLIAAVGKVLTDGVNTTYCIDTDEPSQWTEIDKPTPEEPEEDDGNSDE